MEKGLDQFRQEVERLRAGRKGGSGPFPEPLRAFAVRYLAHALEKGDTVKAVVERLGVSEPTLQAWRRGQTPGSKKTPRSEPRAEPLLPVVVHPPKPRAASPVATTFAVVSPQGWRVEGLGLEEAAQLLRRLAC
ncbi:transposase [Archangium lansingense]|uniref:transposase n=1 Tax=Archangium lansingense TaxID=2995310 RepID=UPI003B79E0F7